jgi:hypothetical protein
LKGRDVWSAFGDMGACEVGKRVFSNLKTDSQVVLLKPRKLTHFD